MLKSLKQMMNISEKSENWVKYLYFTNEKNYNLNRIKSLKEISKKQVFNYVKNTLEILDSCITEYNLSEDEIFILEETLKWSDVAKCGYRYKRNEWEAKGYNLFIHNIGSSQIYIEEMGDNHNHVVATLIKTHGLIGQYIMGEVNLNVNYDIYKLLEEKYTDKNSLRKILVVLNKCIVSAVSNDLYIKTKDKMEIIVDRIINNDLECNYINKEQIIEKFTRLRKNITENDIVDINNILDNKDVFDEIIHVFKNKELWYFDAALNDFKIIEIIKILLIINKKVTKFKQISFEKLMRQIYIDYNGNKTINIYKKRIMEAYLESVDIKDILKGNISSNSHIKIELILNNGVVLFDFDFSIQAKKLIEFCEVAYDSDDLYSKAVFMLYDLFSFRRDKYDRFYNEISYLNTMNASMQFKAIILDYIVGDNVLDVGPGGGGLLNMIEDRNPELNVFGIDISQNVIDELNKKKKAENRNWKVVKGDALNLKDHFNNGELDTIIYSSIIHELFSYIETDNKKFNHETIKKALLSAYEVLPQGGRIIIRDGIMTEPKEQYRIIEFKNLEDLNILDRYCRDFKGRKVTYTKVSDSKVKMLVNDAMEFLYTYTWGENSYPLEIQEQFGYFTPNEYINFIKDIFNNKCKIITCNHFLQEGYSENLLPKITIYDENNEIVDLPDSTCLIVIEKQ